MRFEFYLLLILAAHKFQDNLTLNSPVSGILELDRKGHEGGLLKLPGRRTPGTRVLAKPFLMSISPVTSMVT